MALVPARPTWPAAVLEYGSFKAYGRARPSRPVTVIRTQSGPGSQAPPCPPAPAPWYDFFGKLCDFFGKPRSKVLSCDCSCGAHSCGAAPLSVGFGPSHRGGVRDTAGAGHTRGPWHCRPTRSSPSWFPCAACKPPFCAGLVGPIIAEFHHCLLHASPAGSTRQLPRLLQSSLVRTMSLLTDASLCALGDLQMKTIFGVVTGKTRNLAELCPSSPVVPAQSS